MNELKNVVIIGSGPAGYTAAIYAARASLSPVMISGLQIGGQLTLTSDVENWPGEPDGILGGELMENMKKQALKFGTEIIEEMVTEISGSSPFTIKTATRTIEAKAVIIATGASAMWLGVPGEERLQGKGVSACATCDGFFFRGKDIVVAGGGDTAMEEATFLTRFANKVTVVHRREEFRASKAMIEKAKNDPKIEFAFNTVIEEVIGDDHVTGIRTRNVVTNEETVISCNGIFIAIGHKPNTDVFKGFIDLDQKGYIVTIPGSTATNIPGVFACGDVADHVYRQAIVAAGTGSMAALDAERWLESQTA
ncbi:MAG: thioredoxin-disulfide reductase [Patescibacteria group bacterium]|jgi:thioredoxin reductase (NADPH)